MAIKKMKKVKKVIVNEKIQGMIDAKAKYLSYLDDTNNPHPHWTARGISICGNCYSVFSRERMLLVKIKETEAVIDELEEGDTGSEITDGDLQTQTGYLDNHNSNLESTREEMIIADHFFRKINYGDSYILPAKKQKSGKTKTYTAAQLKKIRAKSKSLTSLTH